MDRIFKSRFPLFQSVLFVFLLLSLSSCGYSNPYSGQYRNQYQQKTIHLTQWLNRTNELGLESEYFRFLNGWFKKSDMVSVVFDKNQSDFRLTGEISSIDLPGLFYDTYDEALEIKIKLTVTFTLYNNRSNSVLWQEKRFTVDEPFLLDPTGAQTQHNKQKALLRIGDEISELIYLRVHEIAANMAEPAG